MGDSIDIQQTMTETAMDTLDMKIRCNPSLKVLNKSEVSLWRTRLSHLQIARLVSQYFGKRHDEKKTLAEVFSKVKFQYCIDNEDHEILMTADYKEVIKGVHPYSGGDHRGTAARPHQDLREACRGVRVPGPPRLLRHEEGRQS